MGKPLRAVIVIDFEAQTFQDATELDTAIQKKAQKLCDELVYLADESYPLETYNKPSHLMKENCSGLTKFSGLDFGRIFPSQADGFFRE